MSYMACLTSLLFLTLPYRMALRLLLSVAMRLRTGERNHVVFFSASQSERGTVVMLAVAA